MKTYDEKGNEVTEKLMFCPMGPMSGGQDCIPDNCPWWMNGACAVVRIAEALVITRETCEKLSKAIETLPKEESNGNR